MTQPPSGTTQPPIPVAIDELLAMAAVDTAFAEALITDRQAAINAASVALTATEQRVLAATGDATLRQMIASVGSSIPEADRRGFLGRSAAALLALVTGGLAAGATGCECSPMVKGVRPDRPPRPAPAPEPEPATAQPDQAVAAPDSSQPDAYRRPKRPKPRGIRPDRPSPSRGIRPRRPTTKGIRPDRP